MKIELRITVTAETHHETLVSELDQLFSEKLDAAIHVRQCNHLVTITSNPMAMFPLNTMPDTIREIVAGNEAKLTGLTITVQ